MMRSGLSTLDDVADPDERAPVDLHRWRIAGIDHEERLDRGVSELVEFRVCVLPAVRRVRVHLNLEQPIIVELRNLDVGRENRHADRDLVARRQQPVLAQRLEDVGDAGRPAFDREQVHAACRELAGQSAPARDSGRRRLP